MSDAPTFAGLEKDEMRELARILKPEITDAQFNHDWAEYLLLKAKAEALKAQGIAIHPSFGLQPTGENHDA